MAAGNRAGAEPADRHDDGAPDAGRQVPGDRAGWQPSAGARFRRPDGRDRSHLAATERLFYHQLLGIAFPPETQQTARLLITANHARAQHRYQRRLDQANGKVEAVVRVIRSQLGLPPPDTS